MPGARPFDAPERLRTSFDVVYEHTIRSRKVFDVFLELSIQLKLRNIIGTKASYRLQIAVSSSAWRDEFPAFVLDNIEKGTNFRVKTSGRNPLRALDHRIREAVQWRRSASQFGRQSLVIEVVWQATNKRTNGVGRGCDPFTKALDEGSLVIGIRKASLPRPARVSRTVGEDRVAGDFCGNLSHPQQCSAKFPKLGSASARTNDGPYHHSQVTKGSERRYPVRSCNVECDPAARIPCLTRPDVSRCRLRNKTRPEKAVRGKRIGGCDGRVLIGLGLQRIGNTSSDCLLLST